MNRAGREPAEDVKRRLAAACEESGLNVSSARMYLNKTEGLRVVMVCDWLPDQQFDRPLITLLTTVGVDGRWSGRVDIRCSAADLGSARRFWDIPTLRGRSDVMVDDLINQIGETVSEWQQVIAAMKLGIPGPYPFKASRWECPTTIMESGS